MSKVYKTSVLWEMGLVGQPPSFHVSDHGYYTIQGETYYLKSDKTYTMEDLQKLKQEYENEKEMKRLLGVK